MPTVLKFNADAIRGRFDGVAAYLGISGGFDGFCEFVDAFNHQLGVPKKLEDLGVKDPDLEMLAEAALRDPSTGGNPVKLTRENVLSLFEAAL